MERCETISQRVPILVYHHVYPDADVVGPPVPGVIGESEFRTQLQWVVDQGWQVVSTSRVLDWLLDGADLPERALSLHFDNGWLDTSTAALPILREFGVIATCFPITDGLEASTERKSASVRTLTEGTVGKPFMTWPQAGELIEAGWEIGAHTASHPKLAERQVTDGDAAVLEEVDRSDELIGKRLGVVPQHFAYPSGSRNARTDELLADRYRSLRLWHFEFPIRWRFTNRFTSRLAIECQNIDGRVPIAVFKRILDESLRGSLESDSPGVVL